jgi:Ca2+-binding EF-hand superfamily protein
VHTKSKYNTDAIFEIDFPEEDIKLLKEAFTLFQTNDDGVHFEELYFTL